MIFVLDHSGSRCRLLGACKKILSCSKTCNEAVWGDLGVEPLALRRAKSKVVWYSKLLGKDKNRPMRSTKAHSR